MINGALISMMASDAASDVSEHIGLSKTKRMEIFDILKPIFHRVASTSVENVTVCQAKIRDKEFTCPDLTDRYFCKCPNGTCEYEYSQTKKVE